MKLTHDLHALRRIIIAVKAYRHQTGDYLDPARNESLDTYLKEYLSIQDCMLATVTD
ncbi:hypothetical protein GCM10027423_64520 [Spirosoma arcticum]